MAQVTIGCNVGMLPRSRMNEGLYRCMDGRIEKDGEIMGGRKTGREDKIMEERLVKKAMEEGKKKNLEDLCQSRSSLQRIPLKNAL